MSKKVGVIICAAGTSSRFGDKRKKQLADVAGRAAFLRSVEVFADRDDVKQILLGISEEEEELIKVKWGDVLGFHGTKVFIGGTERFDTVSKGLELVKSEIEIVAVHDAARPCVTKEWVDEVIKAASKTGAAILACPVRATIKKCKAGLIVDTVDRSELYEAQTPQVFSQELLKRAYGNMKNLDTTLISDDAQLVEALGEKVSIVETDASNIKLTHKSDIAIAEAILKSRPQPKREGPIGPYIEAQW
ncbi:MAG: 2-C-methyl-D-erythritol 4-phosphate cytidylyltransferase [Planctomycetota bacterium]